MRLVLWWPSVFNDQPILDPWPLILDPWSLTLDPWSLILDFIFIPDTCSLILAFSFVTSNTFRLFAYIFRAKFVEVGHCWRRGSLPDFVNTIFRLDELEANGQMTKDARALLEQVPPMERSTGGAVVAAFEFVSYSGVRRISIILVCLLSVPCFLIDIRGRFWATVVSSQLTLHHVWKAFILINKRSQLSDSYPGLSSFSLYRSPSGCSVLPGTCRTCRRLILKFFVCLWPTQQRQLAGQMPNFLSVERRSYSDIFTTQVILLLVHRVVRALWYPWWSDYRRRSGHCGVRRICCFLRWRLLFVRSTQ